MNKKVLAFAAVAIVAVFLIVAFVSIQYAGSLQAQAAELSRQNDVLLALNSTLQSQLNSLQSQNREQLDRLSDYTYQLALERPLKVAIVDAYCSKGWAPLGGVTGSFPANVTIFNNDVVPLCGLTVSFHFVDKNGGLVGYDNTIKVDRIDTGASRVVSGSALANIDTDVDGLACKITLQAGSVTLYTWIQALG